MTPAFWSDLIVGIVSAAFGAGLTVLIGLFTYRREQRLREHAAVRRLADKTARRRALVHVTSHGPVDVASPEMREEVEWCAASVRSLREDIEYTRQAAQPTSPIHAPLDEMTRACNRYLEQSKWHTEFFIDHLAALRSSFTGSMEQIATLSRLTLAMPGAKAF